MPLVERSRIERVTGTRLPSVGKGLVVDCPLYSLLIRFSSVGDLVGLQQKGIGFWNRVWRFGHRIRSLFGHPNNPSLELRHLRFMALVIFLEDWIVHEAVRLAWLNKQYAFEWLLAIDDCQGGLQVLQR